MAKATRRMATITPISRPAPAGIVLAGLSTVCGFALVWHIWWMAIVGFAGIVISWIVKSFDEDVDYYVPVAEIEKLENQHFDEITKAGLKNGN